MRRGGADRSALVGRGDSDDRCGPPIPLPKSQSFVLDRGDLLLSCGLYVIDDAILKLTQLRVLHSHVVVCAYHHEDVTVAEQAVTDEAPTLHGIKLTTVGNKSSDKSANFVQIASHVFLIDPPKLAISKYKWEHAAL
jgi:hypothetical protein